MWESILDFFRRRSISKDASAVPTGLLPLDAIHSAVAFIDVEDTSFNECKNAILSYFKARGIKCELFFIDFRKLSEGERLITSITTTILKKDLNWYGRPSREKVSLMLEGEPDLFISLLPTMHFPLEYMARCSRARFKVGRCQPASGPVFDLVLSDSALPQDQAFVQICKLLETVR